MFRIELWSWKKKSVPNGFVPAISSFLSFLVKFDLVEEFHDMLVVADECECARVVMHGVMRDNHRPVLIASEGHHIHFLLIAVSSVFSFASDQHIAIVTVLQSLDFFLASLLVERICQDVLN